MEIWKDIKDYEGLYQVSNLGNVKSLKRNYIFNKNHDTDGYVICSLTKNGKAKMFRVNRLVGIHFIDNPDNKPVVHHKDGNKINNNVSNLQWVTISENVQHACDTGLLLGRKGIKHHKVKLTESEVKQIKYMSKNLKLHCGLGRLMAKHFNVSFAMISLICNNKNWQHIEVR